MLLTQFERNVIITLSWHYSSENNYSKDACALSLITTNIQKQ